MAQYNRRMRILILIAASIAAAGFSTFVSKSEEAIRPTVRQDRIWFYKTYAPLPVIDSVKFIRLEVIGEHEYHVYNGIGDLPYLREEAFMREENGRIYRYMKDSIDTEHGPGEYLLYDLNAQKDESFEALQFKYDVSENTVGPYFANITVTDKWMLGYLDPPGYLPTGGGAECELRCMRVSVDGSRDWANIDNLIYEEAGPVYRFSGIWTVPILPEDGETCLLEGYRFDGMTDTDGNLICLGGHAVGVEEIEDTTLEESGRIYDLNGREIVSPDPGTIYIQNGRKKVARR